MVRITWTAIQAEHVRAVTSDVFGDLLVTVLSILPTSQNFMYILYYRDYIMKNYMGFWPVARAKHHSDAK